VALSLARQYNVPSLTIQPALISDHPRYGALYADKVAVMDEHSRRVFVERGGVAPERVIVTGLPRWDSISRVISEARIGSPRTVRQSLGLGVEDRLVVFATQALSPSYTKRMIQATMYALSSHTDAQLVIRLHPRESLETYKSLLAELEWVGREPIMVTDIDLHALLAASDLLVTGFSNVALEAALLDRPVLIVNLAGEPDALPFVQDGIALGAYSEAEVKQQLAKALDDSRTIEELQSRRHQYLYHNPQLLDGQSTKRVADLLWQMRNKCDHLDEVL